MGGKLVGVVVFLVLGTIVLRSLERIFPARDAANAPIRTALFARARLTDVAHAFFNEIVTKPLVKVVTIGVVLVFIVAMGLPHDKAHLDAAWHASSRITHWPLAVQIPLALVAADLVAYWSHRALHYGLLWRFHAIHHSSRALDWLAGARNHPLAEAFSAITVVSTLLLAGFDPRVLAATAPIGLWAIFLHANVSWGTTRPWRSLRYVISTPLFHRWHHAHLDALPDHRKSGVNFAALLPVWDVLFGTFWAPAEQPAAFGTDANVPSRFVAQLVFPFRKKYPAHSCVRGSSLFSSRSQP